MEPPEDMEGRTFVEVMSEKYSPENFPYRRGPGMGVVVVPTAGPQGSPMKGELKVNEWPIRFSFSSLTSLQPLQKGLVTCSSFLCEYKGQLRVIARQIELLASSIYYLKIEHG